jgi:hypothetical protein
MASQADKPAFHSGCRCGGSKRGQSRCHESGNHHSGNTVGHPHSAVKPAPPTHGGSPLSGQAQREWSQRFGGTDFSGVRLHTDNAASDAAARLGAESWTAGNHIGFARGRFQPATPTGERLLAHELAHVVQQRGSVIVPNRVQDNPVAEVEADRGATGRTRRGQGRHRRGPKAERGRRYACRRQRCRQDHQLQRAVRPHLETDRL